MTEQATTGSNRIIRPPRWEYLVLSLIILLLIVLGVWGAIVADKSKEPLRVSDRFVYSLLSGDAEAAYELTAEPFRQAKNDQQFNALSEEFNQTIKTQPRQSGYRIERTTSGILLATVEYEIPGTVDNRLIVKLTQENDIWRVLNINNLP